MTKQFRNAPQFDAPSEPEPETEPAQTSTDWEGQLAVRRKQLELAGK